MSAPGAAAGAASRTPWVAVVAVLGSCALVVLVGWAAVIGPQQVFTGPGPRPATETTTTTAEAPRPPGAATRREVEDRRAPTWVRVLVTVVGTAVQLAALAGMVLAAALVVRRIRTTWQRRRRRGTPVAGADFETLHDAGRRDAVRGAMAADAAEQRRVLGEGEPRDAIVACWHRFEVQAAHAGLARHPWETSSEFALRMLDIVDADGPAVRELLELYREARFSGHVLGEPQRHAAAGALARIQRGRSV